MATTMLMPTFVTAAILCTITSISAWSPDIHRAHSFFRNHRTITSAETSCVHDEYGTTTTTSTCIRCLSSDESNSSAPIARTANNTGRRQFITATAAITTFLIDSTDIPEAFAVEASSSSSTKYISGKPPQVPGEKKKKSDDTKGTRKDANFLRSISDCKNQCQSTPGSDGFSKPKEDCLSECQDICCTTYEQCSFNIVPRI